MGETFAQEFCSLAPCRASGLVIGARRVAPCTVRVADGELTIGPHGGKPVIKIPASELEITSPVLGKFAPVVFLQAQGELVAVEFDFVYQRKKFFSSRQRHILRAAQAVFLASSITYIPATRLGHRLAAQFTAALLAAGARKKNTAKA
jgi:hypothetical protein